MPVKPASTEALLTGPARWREWKRLLDEGTYRNAAELARAVGVSRAAVTQGMKRLALQADSTESTSR